MKFSVKTFFYLSILFIAAACNSIPEDTQFGKTKQSLTNDEKVIGQLFKAESETAQPVAINENEPLPAEKISPEVANTDVFLPAEKISPEVANTDVFCCICDCQNGNSERVKRATTLPIPSPPLTKGERCEKHCKIAYPELTSCYVFSDLVGPCGP